MIVLMCRWRLCKTVTSLVARNLSRHSDQIVLGYVYFQSKGHLFLFYALFALLLGCEKAEVNSVTEVPRGVVADWPSFGATPGGTHYSIANQITSKNVAQLQVAWEHRSGDIRKAIKDGPNRRTQTSLQVTPIVVRDRLYYCTPFNRVFSLNAETGEELWSFDPEVDMDLERVFTNCRGVSSWESGSNGFCEKRIFVGTLDARLIALDANTGALCTDFGEGGIIDTSDGMSKHHPSEYGITSPPAILGNRLITGSMVLDNQRVDSPSGVVRAYDVKSGKLLWAWTPGREKTESENDTKPWAAGTTNVWSIISVDEKRDLIFLPTGNTTPDFFGGHRDGADFYSSSVVALEGSTGKVVWHYQMVHHDLWDYDTPSQPTLVDLVVDNEEVPALVQVTKMGMTFVLNRETGEPLWPVEERPVPATGVVSGEYVSATQPFPTHIPHLIDDSITEEDAWGLTYWDKGKCAEKFSKMNGGAIYTPPSLQGTLLYPSNAGGNNWGSPAVDIQSKIMVVFTTRLASMIKLVPRAQCEGVDQPQNGTPFCVFTGFVTSPLGIPCSAPPWGTLDAIDLQAGKLLWSVPLGTSRDIAPFPFWWLKGLPGFGGPMITSTGLVFSGVSNEHAFRAFDLYTGQELWKVRLPTAANAVPITYQVRKDGKQFVVIAAGGHHFGSSPPSDHIIAYSLPN